MQTGDLICRGMRGKQGEEVVSRGKRGLGRGRRRQEEVEGVRRGQEEVSRRRQLRVRTGRKGQ